MPWTRKQVRYLLSSGSPLSEGQQESMKSELHANPEMGHERKGSSGMAKNWIQGAVKHPGALTEAAKRNGRSKLQEAEAEKKSSNPRIRARGALGARFIKHEV